MEISCDQALRATLYSDQIIPANRRVDDALLRILGRPSVRVGYIPSTPDPKRRFFDAKVAYYAAYGISDIKYFEPADLGSEERSELLRCDAIHLSGGDTFHFLERLRAANLIAPLQKFALNGGVLIGTSAGALLMTPSVALEASFQGSPPIDAPEHRALDLLPFEFFPHLQSDAGYLPMLLSYSTRNSGRLILACPDGDGVVVENGAAKLIGDVVQIKEGARVSW